MLVNTFFFSPRHTYMRDTEWQAAIRAKLAKEQAARTFFFGAKHFAVAGASSDPKKFGNIILKSYLNRKLPVTPINPRSATVTVEEEELATVASSSKLPEPGSTSISVVTPPVVTAELLKEAKECGIRAVWLQPGTYDKDTKAWALREFPGAAVISCILDMGSGDAAGAGYVNNAPPEVVSRRPPSPMPRAARVEKRTKPETPARRKKAQSGSHSMTRRSQSPENDVGN